jgi:glycosyltransferase involved in cell wall biosynthesis
MRIGINGRFLSAARITGVERVAHELCTQFSKATHNSDTFMLFGETTAVVKYPCLRGHGEGIGRKAIQRHLWEQARLPTLVRKHNVDLLFNPINTAPAILENQVVSIHDVAFLQAAGWHNGLFAAYYSWLIPLVASRSRGIITGSVFSKTSIIESFNIDPSKVRVIPNGVSPLFRPVEGELARQQFNLPEQYVLFVGSLEPRKNLKTLLLAFERLRARPSLKDLGLVLVGCSNGNFSDPDLASAFRQLDGGVTTLGYVPDEALPALYSGALAFAYPSLYEGFGLPVLEAMACGAPVIVANTTSLPEVAGDGGLLLDPEDPDAWADAIAQLYDDEAKQRTMKERSLHRATQFTWERTAAETMRYFRELGA